MTKQDQILENVTDIKVKVGKIETHLQDINGTLVRHEKDISLIRKFSYRVGGAAALIIFLTGIGVTLIK